MRKMIAFLDVGLLGCDGIEAFIVSDDATQKQIDEEVWQMAQEHGNSWEEGETEEEIEQFWENVCGHAEDYDQEKHDDLRPGGGSFEDDFAILMK